MNARAYKNIIFDLGGVILNLDEQRTIDAFARLSNLPPEKIADRLLDFQDYLDFEKGLIAEDAFRSSLRNEFGISNADEEIDEGMNAMLLDIPFDIKRLMKSLNGHRLYLLSNTNSIHLKRFNKIFTAATGDSSIDNYFEKAYYSHLCHMRKPNKEIFELVMRENQLQANETLFLDDKWANLQGASSVGIHTFQIKNPSHLVELFL